MAGELIPRIYSNFRGADFRGEEINLVRSPDCLNVWKDYKETESIRTRPELELCHKTSKKVLGIYFYQDTMFTHEKDENGKYWLTRWDTEGDYERLIELSDKASNGFVYENEFYLMDGQDYIKCDGKQAWSVFSNEEVYIPTTSIARKPGGGGNYL